MLVVVVPIDIVVVTRIRTIEGGVLVMYHTGNAIAKGATISILIIVVCRNVCIGKASFLFKITNLPTNAANEHNIEIIIVLCGEKPLFRKIYDNGRFNSSIPLTTIWYCFILPVACAKVCNEPEIEPINMSTRINRVKIVV